jgi:hypothetical protein
MTSSAVAEATWPVDTTAPFSREAVLRVLDRAPDGYKLLARLVEDPCDLVSDYDPRTDELMAATGTMRPRSRGGKLREQLRAWLIAGLLQENS